MKILNYDGVTGEFSTETNSKPSPIEVGVFLLPANAVFTVNSPLPVLAVNEVAVWDFNASWVVTPDFRADKSYYLLADGSVVDFVLGTVPDGTMSQTFPAAVQAVIDEQQRVSEIKIAGLGLINATFPALNSIDEIKFQAEFWLSITPAGRQPTTDFQRVIDIYQTASAAIADGVTQEINIVWP